MKRKKILILDHVETYIEQRDLGPDYCQTLRTYNRKFCEWLGGVATLDRLESKTFNAWVTSLRQTHMALNTVDSYRRSVLCVWRDAYESELVDNPPLRIKRLKKPRIVVEAFTHEDIGKLIGAADRLQGYLKNGIRRAHIWRAFILCAYTTGLRRGDLLRLKRAAFKKDGCASVVQRKTGYVVRVKLSVDCEEALAKLKPDNDDDRLLPWPCCENAIGVQFRKLVESAGVRKGQFRWLRRSAGSYAESVTIGGGARLLGHRDERVFRKHYEDLDITQTTAIQPPPDAVPVIAATA